MHMKIDVNFNKMTITEKVVVLTGCVVALLGLVFSFVKYF